MELTETDIIVATVPPDYVQISPVLAITHEMIAQIKTVKIECQPIEGEPFVEIIFGDGSQWLLEDLEMFLPWLKHTQKSDGVALRLIE